MKKMVDFKTALRAAMANGEKIQRVATDGDEKYFCLCLDDANDYNLLFFNVENNRPSHSRKITYRDVMANWIILGEQ